MFLRVGVTRRTTGATTVALYIFDLSCSLRIVISPVCVFAHHLTSQTSYQTGALRSRPFGGTLSMATIGYATNSFGTKVRAFARKLRVACGRLTPPDSLSGREGLTFQCPKARPKPQR